MKTLVKLIAIALLAFLPMVSYAFWIDQTVKLKRTQGDASLVLENATISAITKDNRGFMWFASERNMLCYDGISSVELPAPPEGLMASKIAQTPEELFLLYNEKSDVVCFDRRQETFISVVSPQECAIPTSYDYHKVYGLFAANSKGLFKVDYSIEIDDHNGQKNLCSRPKKSPK